MVRLTAFPGTVGRFLPRSLTNRVFALYGLTLLAFVAAGLGLFLKYQFMQRVEESQQASVMLIEVVSQSVQDSVIIGDYDTVRKTLQRAVQGSAFARASFIDMGGARVEAESVDAIQTHPPAWLVRWMATQLYDVNHPVSVGGKDYGGLRLQYDAPVVAARLWSLSLVALGVGLLGLVGGLLLMRIALAQWLGSLDRLQAFEAALRSGRLDAPDLLDPNAPTEIRQVVDMFNRTALLVRELDHQKFALDQHAIVSITDAEGNITYANDRFCEISGYAREALLGQNHRIIGSGQMPEGFFADLWQTIVAGKVWHGEICNRKRSGALYWVNATIVPLHGDDGQVAQYIAIRTDITDRKTIESSLQAAKNAADLANSAKSEFLANMSHEIRTPMNGIIGMTELLLMTDLTPQQKRYLDLTKRTSHALLTVLNDILDFSKIEAGKLVIEAVELNVADVINDSLSTLSLAAGDKGLELITRIDAQVPHTVVGDPGRLRQVLLNLVGNAVKFTSRGSVTTSVAVESRSGAQVVLHFAVQDTGVGIAQDKQSLIFEAFSQEDASVTRRAGGTGLGLAICLRLVHLMDGRIWLESMPGTGSTFHFTAVLAVPQTAARAAPVALPSDGNSPAAEAQHVLLVEDNEINQLVATSLFKRWGYPCTVATNGQEALDILQSGSFNVVFMDLHMPVMDGLEATRRIRAREQLLGLTRTPIVALTAKALDSDRASCLAAGMDDFVSKPFQSAEVLAKLQQMTGTGQAASTA